MTLEAAFLEIRSEIERHQAEIARLKKKLESLNDLLEGDLENADESEESGAQNPSQGRIGEVVYRILANNGGPMKIDEIRQKLDELGRSVAKTSLSTLLKRENLTIVKVGRGLYQAAEEIEK